MKVQGPEGSADFQTLQVRGPLQKLLLPLTFRSNVPLPLEPLANNASLLIWHLLHNVKLKVKSSSIFVAFLENMNFIS